MGLPLIGTGLQALGGIISLAQGNRQQREARGLKSQRDAALSAIQLEDPREVAVLEETRRRRRAFETGTAFESQLRNLRAAQSGTQQNILRAAGGAGGAAIAGLSRSQLATGKAVAQIGQTALKAQLNLTDLIGQQTQQLVNRKTQIQSLRFQQASADFARRQSEANANRNAGIASIVGAGASLLGALGEGIPNSGSAARQARRANRRASRDAGLAEVARQEQFIADNQDFSLDIPKPLDVSSGLSGSRRGNSLGDLSQGLSGSRRGNSLSDLTLGLSGRSN